MGVFFGQVFWSEKQQKVCIGCIILLTLFLSPFVSAQEYVKGIVLTEKDPLNIRRGPKASYPIVGQAERGSLLKITGNLGLWYYVTLTNGVKGYVYGEHIRLLFSRKNGINDGLILYYPLNGDAMDQSGGGRKGIIGGMRPALDRYGYVNRAIWLDGLDDFIRVPDDQHLRLSDGDFTIALWVYLTRYNDSYQSALLSKRNKGGENGWILSVTGEQATAGKGRVYYQVSGGLDPYGYSSNTLPLNVWKHIAVTYQKKESILIIYINGINVFRQQGIPSPNSKTVTDLYIGKDSFTGDNGYFFQGMMDDIRIYRKRLTEGEINSLFLTFSEEN